MKKYIQNSLIILFIILLSLHFSSYKRSIEANEVIQKQYDTQLKHLQESVHYFSKEVQKFTKGTQDDLQLRKSYLEVRKAYKATEYLLTYFDADFADKFINGAPLLHIEENVANLVILDPEGLQVIDEVLYANQIENQKLLKLTKSLIHRVEELVKNHQSIKVYDRHVFEASRIELIRMLSLGITGFDTPGSLEGVNDAQYSLSAMAETFQIYADKQPTKKRKKLARTLVKDFKKAAKYIQKNNNFETFNRFEFIQQHINPLYGKILDFHLETGVETMYETQFKKYSINYYSKNIFANDFLDASFYLHNYKSEKEKYATELGKMLFFDPILSQNNERSCASCHNPKQGFTDNQAKSIALDFKGTVNRNAPTLLNAIYADRFFHDLRSDNLTGQIEHVVFSEKEFSTTYIEMIQKLQQSPAYQAKFKEAFPREQQSISKFTISRALSNYMKTLTGFNSKFDQLIRDEEKIDQDVVDGFNLFMGKANCGTCHFAPTFSGLVPPLYKESESEVLGVTETSDLNNPVLDPDLGRFGSTVIKEKVPFYKNSFKTVTVRNVELTAPYMHNGAYETLDKVLEFYNEGGGAGLGLDIPHQTLGDDKLHLSTKEVAQLKAFMISLTDTTNLTDLPKKLPAFPDSLRINTRKIGGSY